MDKIRVSKFLETKRKIKNKNFGICKSVQLPSEAIAVYDELEKEAVAYLKKFERERKTNDRSRIRKKISR